LPEDGLRENADVGWASFVTSPCASVQNADRHDDRQIARGARDLSNACGTVTPETCRETEPTGVQHPVGSLASWDHACSALRTRNQESAVRPPTLLISLGETPQHSPDPLSDDLRCHRFCPCCPRQPPTIASFFLTADVANSRSDNDLSEELIRGSPLRIRRLLVPRQYRELRATTPRRVLSRAALRTSRPRLAPDQLPYVALLCLLT